MNHKLKAGLIPMPVASERQIRLTAASDAMLNAAWVFTDKAMDMLDRPGAERVADELIALIDHLRDESSRLAADAGVPFSATPLRRGRGDPVDVSPFPPPLSDLRAVWRWLREWQCGEGRLRPRSARERAIAQTGSDERQKVKNASARRRQRGRGTPAEGRGPR